MIISRAPFRVSFCGGGSDIESFYKRYGGCVLTCTIRKYVYICIHPSFNKNTVTLKYSKTEEVTNYDEIEHKYFRVMLKDYGIKGVEISSIADVPAGTGLGSSSAFTVATLKAFKAYQKKSYSTYVLANEACDVEINKAGSPIGKQDQFASAFGGINFITFHQDGKISVEPVIMPKGSEEKLQNNLLLFFTGITHDANKILSEQTKNIQNMQDKIKAQLKLCDMAKELRQHFEKGDIDYLGKILKDSWEIKKSLSSQISNNAIDDIYQRAIKAGADGGKLLGAGGGGFMLFYVKPEHQESVRRALKDLLEIEFKFDFEGATIIYGNKF